MCSCKDGIVRTGVIAFLEFRALTRLRLFRKVEFLSFGVNTAATVSRVTVSGGVSGDYGCVHTTANAATKRHHFLFTVNGSFCGLAAAVVDTFTLSPRLFGA